MKIMLTLKCTNLAGVNWFSWLKTTKLVEPVCLLHPTAHRGTAFIPQPRPGFTLLEARIPKGLNL